MKEPIKTSSPEFSDGPTLPHVPGRGISESAPLNDTPVPLTSKAGAETSNQLPKQGQLHQFEQDLEEHDPGNRDS